MKFIITVIFSLLYTTILISQSLSIEIKLDKREYYIYEPIRIVIEIKNESSQPLTFAFDHYTIDFNILITHNSNKNNCQGYSEKSFRPIILESGETYYRYYSMLEPFGCTNSPYEKGLYLEHLIEGDYIIELEYNFGKEVLNNGDDLIVKSNKLEFGVKNPSNKIHMTQLKKCLSVLRDFKKYDIHSFSDVMNEIIELDKNSPYSIFATECLVSRYGTFGKNSKAQEIMLNFCKDFPNSNLALSYSMNDRVIMREIVNRKELKGTLVQEYSQKVKESRARIKYEKQSKNTLLKKGGQK